MSHTSAISNEPIPGNLRAVHSQKPMGTPAKCLLGTVTLILAGLLALGTYHYCHGGIGWQGATFIAGADILFPLLVGGVVYHVRKWLNKVHEMRRIMITLLNKSDAQRFSQGTMTKAQLASIQPLFKGVEDTIHFYEWTNNVRGLKKFKSNPTHEQLQGATEMRNNIVRLLELEGHSELASAFQQRQKQPKGENHIFSTAFGAIRDTTKTLQDLACIGHKELFESFASGQCDNRVFVELIKHFGMRGKNLPSFKQTSGGTESQKAFDKNVAAYRELSVDKSSPRHYEIDKNVYSLLVLIIMARYINEKMYSALKRFAEGNMDRASLIRAANQPLETNT